MQTSGLILLLALGSACQSPVSHRDVSATSSSAALASTPPSTAPLTQAAAVARPEDTLLCSLPLSAYQTALALTDDAILLLGNEVAFRVVPGSPPARLPIRPKPGATHTRSSIVFFAEAAIWKANHLGQRARKLAGLTQLPHYFVSNGDDFAWVTQGSGQAFQLERLRGNKPQVLYVSTGSIDAANMLEDWIFFVERGADGSFRIGGVPSAGGAPTFSAAKSGRSPAQLAVWHELYFYEGSERSLYQLSPDLKTERRIVRDSVCSPLAAAADHVYCAHVGGLFEVSVSSGSVRKLAAKSKGMISAVAANAARVAWLSDEGNERLELHVLERAAPR